MTSQPALSRTAAIDQLMEYGLRLNSDRLAVGPAGNLSVRAGDLIAITPSQIPYDKVTPESICFLDADGTQVSGGKVSAETPMHLLIYRSTDAQAVVHTHSPLAVALSTVADELPAIHYAILRSGKGPTIRVAPYERFGSDELAQSALDGLHERTAVILQNHGTITYGTDLPEAYERAQLLEWLAEVYLAAKACGAPRILSAEELSAVAAESTRRRYGAGLNGS